MPKIRLSATAYKSKNGCVSMMLTDMLGGPSRDVEIKTVADAKVAFTAFRDEMAATGKPYYVSATFMQRSGRKPKGFDAARNELNAYVNEEAAREAA